MRGEVRVDGAAVQRLTDTVAQAGSTLRPRCLQDAPRELHSAMAGSRLAGAAAGGLGPLSDLAARFVAGCAEWAEDARAAVADLTAVDDEAQDAIVRLHAHDWPVAW